MKHKIKIHTSKKKEVHSSPLSTFLIILGSLILLVWGVHRFAYNRALSLSDALLASYKNENSVAALPIHIALGTHISLPIVEAGKVNGIWTVSPTSANHVHQSALPGEKGNIIIYGHNLNKIFGFLMDAKVGDIIKIRMTDGTLHQYSVTETLYVSPSQTDLLRPTKEETLTLYTCAGLLDSLRFIVRAKPLLH